MNWSGTQGFISLENVHYMNALWSKNLFSMPRPLCYLDKRVDKVFASFYFNFWDIVSLDLGMQGGRVVLVGV